MIDRQSAPQELKKFSRGALKDSRVTTKSVSLHPHSTWPQEAALKGAGTISHQYKSESPFGRMFACNDIGYVLQAKLRLKFDYLGRPSGPRVKPADNSTQLTPRIPV